MKTIKYLFWLIVLGLIGTLVYQNQEYFMTGHALTLDLKVSTWNWTLPELQNVAYFGICFVLGVILVWIKSEITKYGLRKAIKTRDNEISGLKDQVNLLKTELEVFKHDPYIKNGLEKKAAEKEIPIAVNEDGQGDNTSGTTD